MSLYMYDAAYAPSLATCKKHGAIAMSHYMTRSYANTSAQPNAIRAAGMGAVFNWEAHADQLKRATRAAGQQYAEEALAAYPKDAPRNGTTKIYYSVDTDLVNLGDSDNAFRGINDVHKGTGIKVGLYGEGGLIERLHAMGLVQGKQWLSMSEGFGGFQHAMQSGLVAMVQMHAANGEWIGTDVANTDRNTVLDPYSLDAWWPTGSHYLTHTTPAAPAAPITDLEEDDDMEIVEVSQADCKAKKKQWPGWFTLCGRQLTHVETAAELHTRLRRQTGGKSAVISYNEYKALGGK